MLKGRENQDHTDSISKRSPLKIKTKKKLLSYSRPRVCEPSMRMKTASKSLIPKLNKSMILSFLCLLLVFLLGLSLYYNQYLQKIPDKSNEIIELTSQIKQISRSNDSLKALTTFLKNEISNNSKKISLLLKTNKGLLLSITKLKPKNMTKTKSPTSPEILIRSNNNHSDSASIQTPTPTISICIQMISFLLLFCLLLLLLSLSLSNAWNANACPNLKPKIYKSNKRISKKSTNPNDRHAQSNELKLHRSISKNLKIASSMNP